MKNLIKFTMSLSSLVWAITTQIPSSTSAIPSLAPTTSHTSASLPHRIALANVSDTNPNGDMKAPAGAQQIPYQFCPEFFGHPPKLCSDCGGDTKTASVCDQLLVSGAQYYCPPGGPYDRCLGYYCKCQRDGTEDSPKLTSSTVIDGATATVVWEPMTLTNYASLRSKTTVTLTEAATATTGNVELETVVALVFAGGIAWWAASQAGAAGAALAIKPPEGPPDGSKEDDPACQSNPKEECKDCGGADSFGLCKSGSEAGCPCDEVQHCPNEPPKCSDNSCGGDNGKSQCSAKGEINGCLCCPDEAPECPDISCNGDNDSAKCQSSQLKGCGCIAVGETAAPDFAPEDPPVPDQNERASIGALVFSSLYSGDYHKVPGYTPKSTSTSCSFTTTSFPASLESVAGVTGVRSYCTCGSIMAAIQLAASGTVTTSYCAIGLPVPTGYTYIPADNGHPATTSVSSSTPPATTGPVCNSLDAKKFIAPDILLADVKDFCAMAAQPDGKGATLNNDFSSTYHGGTPEEVVLTLKFKDTSYDFSAMSKDCMYAMGDVLTNICNAPQAASDYNKWNWKAGGTTTIGYVDYSIQPQIVRHTAGSPIGKGSIALGANMQSNSYQWNQVWGSEWGGVASDNGAGLWENIRDCGPGASRWLFAYMISDGAVNNTYEFYASWFYTQMSPTSACLNSAMSKSGAPNGFDITGNS